MNPGSTVLPRTSMVWAPAGICTSPARPIARKRLPSMTMTEFSIGARPVPSISVPPWTTSVCACAPWIAPWMMTATPPSSASSSASSSLATIKSLPGPSGGLKGQDSMLVQGHQEAAMRPFFRPLLLFDVAAILADGLGRKGHEPVGHVVRDLLASVRAAHVKVAPDGFLHILAALHHLQIGLPQNAGEIIGQPGRGDHREPEPLRRA